MYFLLLNLTGFLDRIVNAIKDFLGIGVSTKTREAMQTSVQEIMSSMKVDDKSLKTSENKIPQTNKAQGI